MKLGSTLFLKIAVLLIGAPVLALSLFGLISLPQHPFNDMYDHLLYPILVGMYVSVIPFVMALIQAFRLLNFIDRKQAFSQASVDALQKIKFCAFSISTIYVVLLPLVFLVADKDDAPGLIIVGTLPIFASFVIGVFAAVLERLLQEAIDIKSENDLTV